MSVKGKTNIESTRPKQILNNNLIDDEFEEISIKTLPFGEDSNYQDNKEEENKKNEDESDEDNGDDSGDSGEADSDNKSDDEDTPNYRNKYKELKETFKNQLPAASQKAIDSEEEAIDEVIEQLKARGMSQEKGIEIQKVRNIKRTSRLISRE